MAAAILSGPIRFCILPGVRVADGCSNKLTPWLARQIGDRLGFSAGFESKRWLFLNFLIQHLVCMYPTDCVR